MTSKQTVEFQITQPSYVELYKSLLHRIDEEHTFIDENEHARLTPPNSKQILITEAVGSLAIIAVDVDLETMRLAAHGLTTSAYRTHWEKLFNTRFNVRWAPIPSLSCQLDEDKDVVNCLAKIGR